MIDKKKNIIVFLAIILGLLNLFLIYQIINKQNKINALTSIIQIVESKERLGNLNSSIVKEIKIKDSINKLKLISVITQEGCISCIQAEINYLNQLSNKYKNFVDIYFIGDNKNYLKALNSTFKYKIITNINEIVDIRSKVIQPFSLLIDSQKKIQKFNIASVVAPEKTEQFYSEVLSLLDIINDN